MNSKRTPTIVIHSMIALAISAESASHQIRQTIPDWQPHLSDGFQGRQLLVLQEDQQVYNGYLCERGTRICASGHDGLVRDYFAWHRASAVEGLISYGDPSSSATTSQFDAMQDGTLANAMPLGFLNGIETSLDFHVRNHRYLSPKKQDRLKMYQDAAIAPVTPKEDPVTGNTIWTVNLGLLPEESLYAMLELHGRQFTGVYEVRHAGSGMKASAADFLATAHQDWRSAYKFAA
ncbi:MAG: hypothetical protein ACREPQ_13765 [Rhodanobacter sp.]